jgi:SpoVK/Ycf46/Vps4 family AAA+-type ATPase
MRALRRRYPQIYQSNDKLLIDPATIIVAREDFLSAVRGASLFFSPLFLPCVWF